MLSINRQSYFIPLIFTILFFAKSTFGQINLNPDDTTTIYLRYTNAPDTLVQLTQKDFKHQERVSNQLADITRITESSVADTNHILTALSSTSSDSEVCTHPLKWQTITLSSVSFAYGLSGLFLSPVKSIDRSIRSQVLTGLPNFHTGIDYYTQFAPAIATLGLGAIGVNGRHPFGKQVYTYALSFGIMMSALYSFKSMGLQIRPDGSSNTSFPSGHTAAAFSGAEALRIEYGWRSPWIGIAGYTVATATGALRVLNNRHWFSDVVAGAGLGFFSTRLSYFLIPKIEKGIFHETPKENAITHF